MPFLTEDCGTIAAKGGLEKSIALNKFPRAKADWKSATGSKELGLIASGVEESVVVIGGT